MKPKNKFIAKLLIFEPWELPDEWINKNQDVEIYTYDDTDAIIIRLKNKLIHNGKNYEYFIANKRNDSKKNMDYNLVRIDEENINEDNLLDLKWWRGGDAFIGTLQY